ncbi:MAG TPA: hypothetical protein PL110_18425, partial [Candidatus Eremiobacteraeota bacterium]|nr:hypothetical protein [Candidatus Eremiobacteraeota bacterium]
YILKNIQTAGLIVSLFLFLFFLFKHIYHYLSYLGYNITGYRYFLVTLIFICISFLIIKIKDKLKITYLINIISITLVLTVLLNIFNNFIRMHFYNQGLKECVLVDTINTIDLQQNVSQPNIYYITVDSYLREDILNKALGYDNSEFINYLNQKGFYIASKSSSNYMHTESSLVSSLNMNYIDLSTIKDNSTAKRASLKLIKNNKVREFLKKYGYKFVNISSMEYTTDIPNADIYINCNSINTFELSLLNMTFLSEMLSSRFKINLMKTSYLKAFESLKETVKLKHPIFVFAHLAGVHSPYLFCKNGEDMIWYKINDKTIKDFKNKLPSKKIELIEGLKDNEYSEEDLNRILNKLDMKEKEIKRIKNYTTKITLPTEVLFIIGEKAIENFKNKVSDTKLNILINLIKYENMFTSIDELNEKLKSYGFTENEINKIKKYTSLIYNINYNSYEIKTGYQEQLVFLNNKLKETIDYIMSNSQKPSIIIVQGDHGSSISTTLDMKEIFSILNVYYLPGNSKTGKLYKEITPVNTFRIIFNTYFNTDLPLLKDINYYSTFSNPYEFIDVTDKVKN